MVRGPTTPAGTQRSLPEPQCVRAPTQWPTHCVQTCVLHHARFGPRRAMHNSTPRAGGRPEALNERTRLQAK